MPQADRAFAPHKDADLSEEESIVWVRPPETFDYVREFLLLESRARGRPAGKKVVGYANLIRRNRRGEAVVRRVFYRYPHDPCDSGCPSEAVDPLTVRPRVPGRQNFRCWRSHDAEAAK